jgi:hypothetical protein
MKTRFLADWNNLDNGQKLWRVELTLFSILPLTFIFGVSGFIFWLLSIILIFSYVRSLEIKGTTAGNSGIKMKSTRPATISDLNRKSWYRFLKILYIVFFTFIITPALIAASFEATSKDDNFAIMITLPILALLFSVLLFKLFQNIFYYIVLGTFKPQK